MGGKTSAKSVNKYINKTYDRVNLLLHKETQSNKENLQKLARSKSMSLNAFIVEAIDEKVEREKPRI